MATYKVYGTTTIGVYQVVEANSEEEAIEKAECEFEGLSSYVGNGGCDKLIGVYGEDCGIDYCDGEVDFEEAYEEE